MLILFEHVQAPTPPTPAPAVTAQPTTPGSQSIKREGERDGGSKSATTTTPGGGAAAAGGTPKRGRGRPPKARPPQGDSHAGDGDVVVLCDSESSSPVKKKTKREEDKMEAKDEEEKDLVTYVADEDETPRSIGKKLGVPASEVVRLNLDSFPRLSQSSQFKHGTPLKVPKEGSVAASEAQEPPLSSSKQRHREDDEDEEGDGDDGGHVPDTAEAKAVAEAMQQYVEIPGRLRVSEYFNHLFSQCFGLTVRHSFSVCASLRSPGLRDSCATSQADLGKLPVASFSPCRCRRSIALFWGSCRTAPAGEQCSSKQ